jgi:hypothetical protein
MNRKVFLAAVLLTIVFFFTGGGKVVYAEEFTEVSVTGLSTMEDWDQNIQVSYEKDFSLSKDGNPEESIYLSFTLKEDSLVRIMQTIAYKNTGAANAGAYSSKLYIYSDSGLANQKMEVSTPKKDGSQSTYQYLEAGTYYIRTTAKYSWGYSTAFTKKICIGSVDADQLLKTTVKVNGNKNKATISVDSSALGQAVDTLQYVTGSYTMKDIDNKIWKSSEAVTADTTGFCVTKNGTYTIRVKVKYASNSGNNVSFSVPVKVSGLDNKKPLVTGVKNGSTYKKTVTIKFSDKTSGIKKATLNGKTVKSGKKVSKKGSYTLKVTDKAGNTKTVKFKIV